MGDVADGLFERGADVLTNRMTAHGEFVVFAGTKGTMRRMTLGNTKAWRELIDDNDPHEDGRLYVRMFVNADSGWIKVLSPDAVRAIRRRAGR